MFRRIDTPDNCPAITQIDANASGIARYVVHYSAIPYLEYVEGSEHWTSFYGHQLAEIANAAEMLHGQKYRGKWYGGGIVFQAYAGDPITHVLAAIARSKDVMLNGEHAEDFIYHYNRIISMRRHPAGKGNN